MDKIEKRIREIVEKLKKEKSVLAIILFGSRAKNFERKESDIDICVVAPEGSKSELFSKILEIMQDEKIDIKIFEDLPLFMKINVIEEGKILYVKDENQLFEYFWKIRKIWEDEKLAIEKLEN